MKKHSFHKFSSLRLLPAILAFSLVFSTFSQLSFAFAQGDVSGAENSASVEETIGTDNFVKIYDYAPNQFTDVPSSEWYAKFVCAVYEYGLMHGVSETKFNPDGHISIAESLTVASMLHNTYHGRKYAFQNSEPWYQAYVNYTLEKNIIAGPYNDYDTPITRGEFAVIIANAFPLSPVNEIEDGAIPDVERESSYYDSVYLLYRAGILSGVDSIGTYKPDSQISRAEVAVILTLIANEQSRIHFELKVPVYPESISISEDFFVPLGDSGRIKATIVPENADRGTKIEWRSSNSTIASVDGNGVITGNSLGEAEITATTENGKTAVCCVYTITQEMIDRTYAKLSISLLKNQLKFPDTLTIHGIWANSKYHEDTEETWIDVFIYYSAANSFGLPVRKEFLTIWKMNTAGLLVQNSYDYTSDHTGYRTVSLD